MVTALTGPKVLPTKVVKLPAEGCARENSASVLPNSATATPAATMVSGDATPAVVARKANPKKKLMAGPTLAIVAAAMSAMPRTPPRSRSGVPPTGPGVDDGPRGPGSGMATAPSERAL